MVDREDNHNVPPFQSKEELYGRLGVQVKGLVELSSGRIAPHFNLMIGLSNVAALLFYELNRHANPTAMLHDLPVNWFGFYLLQSPQLLVLGPFQGRPACMEIQMGRGVCGTAAQKGEALIVPDVHAFKGHIACDSLSNSEIVIPIKTAAGHVVGIIDVDSSQHDFFDKTDAEGLQEIATILSECLEFPMARAFTMNPLLANAAFPQSSEVTPTAPITGTTLVGGNNNNIHRAEGIVGGKGGNNVSVPRPSTKIAAAVIAPALATPPVTVLTHVEEKATVPKYPLRVSHSVGGWEFTVTEFSRILTQEEVRHYEEALGINAIPEIQFAFNTLRIAPAGRSDAPLVIFSLLEVLRSAAAFYRTDTYRQSILPQLQIPVAESWKNAPYETVDTKVDWAWRNNYFGLDEWLCTLKPLEPSMPGVNWGLLKDQTLPILFFRNFDMLEDDLHDRGVVSSSVRIRVMSKAFFILFRHFIQIDGYRVWMREVRLFHEFSVKRSDGQPHIVVREEVRMLDIDDIEKFRHYDSNKYAQEANVVEVHDYYVNIENPTYCDWWSGIGVS